MLLLIFVFVSSRSFAQRDVLPMLRDSLYSEILKEERGFDIVLPAKYDPQSPEKYEMIYVMDAEWSTRITSNIYEFLSIDFMPQSIIVGVNNTPSGKENMRSRDFTPTKVDGNPNTGGADLFLSFIKNELIPYIKKKYKSSGVNTYCGSSLGGLFGMYGMIKEPKLFSSWLLADPSFWWDNGFMKKLAAEHLSDLQGIPLTLLITGREGEAFIGMGTADMDSILKSKAPSSLHWKVNKYSGETHNAMIFRTVYDGLKFTYEGYLKEDLEFHPMNGIIVKDKPFNILFVDDNYKSIHYTTDGTQPTAASAPAAPKVSVVNATTLTARSICNRERYDKTATGHFTMGTTLPATTKNKNATAGGLHYDYYEGSWDSLPDFKKLKPIQSGKTSKDFDLAKLPKQHDFACVQEGQLETQTDGYYLFGIQCDGATRLYIGGKLVIDYGINHPADKFQSFLLPLAKGFYPIRLEYLQKKGNPSLNMVYLKPGDQNPSGIGLEVEYSK